MIAKISNPLLGPPGIRILLQLRGFCGYVNKLIADINLQNTYRFLGSFGVYWSLQYLSTSDATVLAFLAPVFATVIGAVFLGETVQWNQIAAEGMSLHSLLRDSTI
jgi:drug/metabolite transporter (DMT)-like permease